MVAILKRGKNTKKWRGAFLVFAGIILITAFIAFKYNTNRDTVPRLLNFKTYTDDSFGFSFHYPSEYNVFSEGKNEFAEETLIITRDPERRKIMDASRGEYTILILKNKISFDQMKKEVEQEYNYLENLSIKSKDVDGHHSLRINGTNKKATGAFGQLIEPYQEDIVLIDNGDTYISFSRCIECNYNRDEITQIYNSFKFN